MGYYNNYYSATRIELDFVESFREMKNFIVKYKEKNNLSSDNYSILDIGCGLGYLTSYFNSVGKSIGLDTNKEAINFAKERYPNVEFVLGNVIENENITDRQFNIIVCNNVIEHLRDKEREKLFGLINKKLLKDKGRIIFAYYNPYHPVQIIWGFLTRKGLWDKTHVHFWSIGKFVNLIRDVFKIIEVKRTSPFTKMVSIGKYFRAEVLILAGKK